MKALQTQDRVYYPAEIQRLFALAGFGGKTDEWLTQAESSVDFLQENTEAEQIVLFAYLPHVAIQAVLAPLKKLRGVNAKEFANDFVFPSATWCIEHVSGGGQPDRVILASPLSLYGSVLENGEKLVFRRTWPGSTNVSTEISQRLVHALDLHYVEERSAYCRINELGDVEEVIKVIEVCSERVEESGCIVTISSQEFFEYVRLADMGVVHYFDFTRFQPGSFQGWSNAQRFERTDPNLYYDGGVQSGVGSYINGRQIVVPPVGMHEIVRRYRERRNPTNRRFADFKAQDLKTGKRIEVSCDPACTSNYFEPGSNKALEMSPVFFRAEVLHKYRADPSKYEMLHRGIVCRGAWHLETYDANDVGQVHTYLRYLRNLPYEEQLYWKSFNEWPKGRLSKRAFETDFQGRFSKEYDPVEALKHKVEFLDAESPEWWEPRGRGLARVVHEPLTSSDAVWADSILALDQLVVEGFKVKALRQLARAMDVEVEKAWASIKLLEACLVGCGVSANQAESAGKALHTIHHLRSIVKGHAAPKKKAKEVQAALSAHGSFRGHFRALAADCDKALGVVIENLGRQSCNGGEQ